VEQAAVTREKFNIRFVNPKEAMSVRQKARSTKKEAMVRQEAKSIKRSIGYATNIMIRH
jgi:hypothetical protein